MGRSRISLDNFFSKFKLLIFTTLTTPVLNIHIPTTSYKYCTVETLKTQRPIIPDSRIFIQSTVYSINKTKLYRILYPIAQPVKNIYKSIHSYIDISICGTPSKTKQNPILLSLKRSLMKGFCTVFHIIFDLGYPCLTLV